MSRNGHGGNDGDEPPHETTQVRAMARELSILRNEVANLANLYVSSYRLHGAHERDEVLTVMQEIVTSMVGSEEFGIFEIRDGSPGVVPSAVFGLDADAIAWVSRAEGIVAECLSDGEIRMRSRGQAIADDALGARLTALVPLKLRDRVSGLVALFSMLPHKPELSHTDMALLELLSSHAYASLHYADLHANAVAPAGGAGPLPRSDG